MQMQRFLLVTGCFAVCVLFATWGFRFDRSASADEKAPPPDTRFWQARLEAAREAYEGYSRQLGVDPAGSNMDLLYQWSRRWMEAERALAPNKDKQSAASTAHRDRMRTWEAALMNSVQKGNAARFELAAVRFYRLEAEQWVAEGGQR
jgi:hypothetical protein